MAYFRTSFKDFCNRSGCDYGDLFKVLDVVSNGAWCAGGALRRTLTHKPLDSDFDFFFKNADQLAAWEKLLPPTLTMVRETQHHKSWKGTLEGSVLPIELQAIRFKFYDSPEEVIDSFDFTITQFVLGGTELVTSPEALWDLGRKKLVLHKLTYPVATMRRMLKYTTQGFTACSGCIATLLKETATNSSALATMDITYVD